MEEVLEEVRETKETRVSVRVSESQRDMIKAFADSQGITVAEFTHLSWAHYQQWLTETQKWMRKNGRRKEGK